jgi:hypothetical protein
MSNDDFDHFNRSRNWWSFCNVPLIKFDVLLAVAYGDAELFVQPKTEDLCFRWRRPPRKRARVYFEMRRSEPRKKGERG